MEHAEFDKVIDDTTDLTQDIPTDVEMISINEDALFEDFKKLQDAIEETDGEAQVDGSVTLEEAVLDFQGGDEEAFNYIFNHYDRKIRNLGRKYNNDELASELFEVLLRAAKRFDVAYKAKFNTYFWRCAQNHIGSQRNMQNAQKRGGVKDTSTKIDPTIELSVEEQRTHFKQAQKQQRTKTLSLNYVLTDQDADAEFMSLIEDESVRSNYDSVSFRVDLENLLNSGILKEKEAAAIKLFWEHDDMTLERAGEQLGGITAPAVHVLLRRIAKKPVAKQLREILAR